MTSQSTPARAHDTGVRSQEGGTLNTLIVRFGAAGYRPTTGFRQPSLGEMVRLGGLSPPPGGAYPGVCGWPAVTPP